MNSDDLQSFIEVAGCGSLSRAAVVLGSDQSTVSRQMARLESATGVRLLHRNGRGVALTEAGEALLAHARRIAASIAEARDAVQTFSDAGPSQVVIAAQPTIARMSFAAIGRVVRQRFPRTRLRFVEGLGSHMLNWLADGDIDLALLYLPSHAGALKVDRLLREPLHLVAPPSFTHIGPDFPVRHLAEVPLILPSTHHGLRLLAESLAQKAGIRLDIAMECDTSTNVTRHLVEQGEGCTLLPLAAVAEEVAQGRLRTARLVEPDVVRDVVIASARNRPPVPHLWDISQALRQEMAQIVNGGGWPDASLAD
jgi:DNA-binding transcriptional LysR family regulator